MKHQYNLFVYVLFHLCCSLASLLFIKETVHPKMKIHILSTHLHADGRSGEIFWYSKHFWTFTGKRHCSDLLNNFSEW